jgi:sec-independent protein translocase protein TatA
VELFSPGHLIPLLIIVAIVFFGWKQLPEMARSVGKSLHIFKAEMTGEEEKDSAEKANTMNAVAEATGAPIAPAVVAAPPVATPVVEPAPPAVAPAAVPVAPPVVAVQQPVAAPPVTPPAIPPTVVDPAQTGSSVGEHSI